ncbi:MAG TPA: hypothetical protein VFI88_02805 [Sphingomicrobium sp.]|jgi:hypothetical protein|nr:hypothetical protein [Sphingomicrobium sp.]
MRTELQAVAVAALLFSTAASTAVEMDPNNPTCPKHLDWSTYRQMKFTPETVDGKAILNAEGVIDEGAPQRLQEVLKANPVLEIWIRSPGGNARAGNEAGKLIREAGIPTRIPSGWACFSACNFVFMGGIVRYVDPGGIFAVHMFTHLGDKDAVREELKQGTDEAIDLIGDVEQDSALLASEDNDFLIRMGVSRKLLTDVMYQQQAIADGNDKSTRRCLTQDEVYQYNVATKILSQ